MFVAIVKMAKDSDKTLHKGLPPLQPVECREFESLEMAELTHPGCRVMTAEQYWFYMDGMIAARPLVRRSWYKRLFGVKA